MTEQQAQNAVTFSALIVGAVFLLRKFSEPAVPTSSRPRGAVAQLAGVGPLPSTSRFVTGWGFAFLVIAGLAQADPDLGGGFAILAAAGDVLTNFGAVAADLNVKLSTPATSKTADLPIDPLAGTAGLGGTDVLAGTTSLEDVTAQLDRIAQLDRLGRTGKLSRADRLDPLAVYAVGVRKPGRRPLAHLTYAEVDEQIAQNAAMHSEPVSASGAIDELVPAAPGS